MLRVTSDEAGTELVPTPDERIDDQRDALQRAEADRQRAEQAQAAAEADRQRAEQAQAAAEAELVALRAEVARLRGVGSDT